MNGTNSHARVKGECPVTLASLGELLHLAHSSPSLNLDDIVPKKCLFIFCGVRMCSQREEL